LREGDQLPSEAQLMDHYGVARMTIRNAMRLLLDEGLVTAEHGRRDKRRSLWIAAEDCVDGEQIEEIDLDVLLDRVELAMRLSA
jgi:DNA-binding FadR family transcriptional regulator